MAISEGYRGVFTHRDAWPICSVGRAKALKSAWKRRKWQGMRAKAPKTLEAGMYHPGGIVAMRIFL
jgi:hypothetical protein